MVLIQIFLKNLFSAKTDVNWIDVSPKVTKQQNKRIHSSTKLTPYYNSLKKKDVYFLTKFIRQKKESENNR